MRRNTSRKAMYIKAKLAGVEKKEKSKVIEELAKRLFCSKSTIYRLKNSQNEKYKQGSDFF